MYAKWIEADNTFSFSPTNNGGVKVDDAYYMQLLTQNSKGLGVIGRDAEGSPTLSVLPPPTDAVLAEQERRWRDVALASAAGLRDRHRDQLEIEVDTALSDEQFKELLVYMQALRDWPQSPDFPVSAHRPVAPAWVDAQTE